MASKQKIVPCLWYDFNGEEAVDFYLSIFPEGKKGAVTHYAHTKEFPQHEGKVLTVEFELFGQHYLALNGGPDFPHSNAVSFLVNCKDQQEIDYYWDKLIADGGQHIQCGWLRDKFGVPWQIVWEGLMPLHSHPDKAVRERVMQAMMGMVKLDIAGLKAAAAGEKKAA